MSELKASVVCTIDGCSQRFELPITTDLYGMLAWNDTYEITVTAPATPEYSEHQQAHMADGSWKRHFVKMARIVGRQADKYAEQFGE